MEIVFLAMFLSVLNAMQQTPLYVPHVTLDMLGMQLSDNVFMAVQLNVVVVLEAFALLVQMVSDLVEVPV